MPGFRHVTTALSGPDSHMIGLADLLAYQSGHGLRLFGASGMGGGVLSRDPLAGLAIRDRADYAQGAGLDAPRQLQVVALDGGPVLLATGRYGTLIEGWQISDQGSLVAPRPLNLHGAAPGALLAFDQAWLGSQHLFLTASRHAAGVQVWSREGDGLHEVSQQGMADSLAPGAVQALAIARPGDMSHVLALDVLSHTLVSFALEPGGRLGIPNRLDLRDGLHIAAPTHLEVIEAGGASFAIIGAAGSSSITVVSLAPNGRMQVTDQVNDSIETRFAGLTVLKVLEAEGTTYVLAGGTDNGLSLMMLSAGGRLVHLASLGDEMREMALQGLSDAEMLWRQGGLDIFVAGEVLPGQTLAGRGITQLRIEPEALVPTLHFSSEGRIHTGTPGPDLFVVHGQGEGDRINGFDPDNDRLDLSGMGRFYSLEDLQITPTATGAVFRFGTSQVTVNTADGRGLSADDFSFSDVTDLWRIPISPPSAQVPPPSGTQGPDLLDGRTGGALLLGEPRDEPFDTVAAQVFRLYAATLDRAPDITGLINWTGRIVDEGFALRQIASGFTNSPEFRQTFGAADDRAFITLLYDNVLDRAPDTQGLENWTGRLERGEMDRPQVVIGFSESQEFRNTTEASALAFSRAGLQAGFSDDVYRLYRATLDRDPDQEGFTNWTARLADGQPYSTIVAGFTNSPEFRQKYGSTTDREFVTLLYNNVLDRAPDTQGLENWTGRLERGEMDRPQVVTGFSQSAEFTASSAPDLRGWMLRQGTDDILVAGAGSDTLMGGLWSDTFVFRGTTGGNHVVVDPEPWDRLVFEGFGYDHPDDLAQHLSQEGADTLFVDQDMTVRFLDSAVSDIFALEISF